MRKRPKASTSQAVVDLDKDSPPAVPSKKAKSKKHGKAVTLTLQSEDIDISEDPVFVEETNGHQVPVGEATQIPGTSKKVGDFFKNPPENTVCIVSVSFKSCQC